MRPIGLDGFDVRFADDADPWRTFSDRDEALKRRAILHALGSRPHGRVLELASGNGSNSVAIAPHALRLDATEGTIEGTRLTGRALRGKPRARAIRLALPGRFPRSRYDAIVIAELLYYLSPRAMQEVARDVAAALLPSGRLVLAHHLIDFHDFAQHAAPLHRRFLDALGRDVTVRVVRRTSRWIVLCVEVGGHTGAVVRTQG